MYEKTLNKKFTTILFCYLSFEGTDNSENTKNYIYMVPCADISKIENFFEDFFLCLYFLTISKIRSYVRKIRNYVRKFAFDSRLCPHMDYPYKVLFMSNLLEYSLVSRRPLSKNRYNINLKILLDS